MTVATSAGSSIEHGSGGHQTCNFSFEGSRDSNLVEMALNKIEKKLPDGSLIQNYASKEKRK